MRYSIEPKEKKYIKGYGFLPFAEKFGNKYGKTLMDNGTKNVKNVRIDAAKTASKRVVQKTAETAGDMTGNKIADIITSEGKSKRNQKNKTNEAKEIYILSEKREHIVDGLKFL